MTYDFDLSAPGTCNLAFYSDNPIVGGKAWCIRGLESDEAKILTLWFNSSLNVLQVLMRRVETRGAWMRFREWMLQEFQTIDFKILSGQQKENMVSTFDRLGSERLPSILKQLDSNDERRREMDSKVLGVMGLNESDTGRLLDELYPLVTQEIAALKLIMAGKGDEEEEQDSSEWIGLADKPQDSLQS